MALTAVVASLDDVPEKDHEHYNEQKDGSFRADIKAAKGYTLDNTTKLKRTISTLRTEIEGHEEKASDLTDDDGNTLDIVEARAAIKKLANLGDDDKDIDAKIKEAVEAHGIQLTKKHATESAEKDKRNGKLAGTVRKLRVEDAIMAALIDESGERTKALAPKMLMPAIRELVRAVEKDGDFVVGIIDPDAREQNRITSRTDSDAPMTVAELVDELRGDKEWGTQFAAKEVKGTTPKPGERDPRPAPGPREPGTVVVTRPSATERLKAAHKAEAKK